MNRRSLFPVFPVLPVFILVALSLWLAPFSAGLAQAPRPASTDGGKEAVENAQADSVFIDTVDVEVVNIDVYVRDSEGNPVRGLTIDDFELKVDKKPATISNFFSVSDGRNLEPRSKKKKKKQQAQASQDRKLADTPAEAKPEPAVLPKNQSLLVVVYIDNYNLTPFKRNRVLAELRQFLRQELTPQDRVMLMTYDRSLHLRHPFTARPENIVRATLDLENLSAQGIHRVRERQSILTRIEDADSGAEAMLIVETFAGSVRNDLAFTLDAMRDVIDNLAGSTGRKALIYVSEGLPMIPAQDLFQAVELKWQESISLLEMYQYDMSRSFHELINQANANRVSFYTIDARGLTVLSQGTVDLEIAGQAGEGALIDSFQNANLQSTIQLMAKRTGGRAIINTNRYLPDLRKISLDFRNYYSLGFASGDLTDGRYHRFEVKLKDKKRGYSVRHRDGYRSKTTETKMHDGTMSALNLDLQDNPLGARLEFGTPRTIASGLFEVPFRLWVPYANLALVPHENGKRGHLRMWLVARDQDEEMSDVQQVPIDIVVTPELLAEKLYLLEFPLTMEAGSHSVAVGIRDDIGQQQSFLRQTITLGEPQR